MVQQFKTQAIVSFWNFSCNIFRRHSGCQWHTWEKRNRDLGGVSVLATESKGLRTEDNAAEPGPQLAPPLTGSGAVARSPGRRASQPGVLCRSPRSRARLSTWSTPPPPHRPLSPHVCAKVAFHETGVWCKVKGPSL